MLVASLHSELAPAHTQPPRAAFGTEPATHATQAAAFSPDTPYEYSFAAHGAQTALAVTVPGVTSFVPSPQTDHALHAGPAVAEQGAEAHVPAGQAGAEEQGEHTSAAPDVPKLL